MASCWNSKDVVQLFQGTLSVTLRSVTEIFNQSAIHLLGLWDYQEYHDERHNIETCIEAERPSWPETIKKGGECQGQGTANRVVDADGEG